MKFEDEDVGTLDKSWRITPAEAEIAGEIVASFNATWFQVAL